MQLVVVRLRVLLATAVAFRIRNGPVHLTLIPHVIILNGSSRLLTAWLHLLLPRHPTVLELAAIISPSLPFCSVRLLLQVYFVATI